ncbi:hypothetical protein F2Q70_00042763 [Brassica cretica]|uniref:ubiquitinyl hydrolase 1 n=1 Tax=Brassica cretica TaxID=69181 RepID=A0A8S9KLV0_BRACR|nr:hypothetical protein F2Q70_00042763 [Brassica cretica]
MLTVSVKWQKKVFEGIEIDPTLPPYVFKAQLYDLTGVPPERQKIMVKGGLLKDDADWSAIGVKDGQKLMMMGTADEIVKAPEKAIVFAEDLPEEEQATHLGYSAGLVNLGNTCYMNSTVQCLKSVPELKSALSNYALTGRSADVDQTSHMLTVATRELFGDLDRSVNAVSPTQFWMILRKKFPQFSQLQNGMHMQQDAEECWTQLLYTLSQSLKAPTSSEDSDAVKALFGVNLRSRDYMRIQVAEKLKCNLNTSAILNKLSKRLTPPNLLTGTVTPVEPRAHIEQADRTGPPPPEQLHRERRVATVNTAPPENPSFEESKPARHLEHEAELTHLHAPPPELAPSRRGNSPPRKSSTRNHLRHWKIQSLDKELSYKTQIRDLEGLTDGPRAANREHVEIYGENLPTKSTETDLSRNHREGHMPSSSNSISL